MVPMIPTVAGKRTQTRSFLGVFSTPLWPEALFERSQSYDTHPGYTVPAHLSNAERHPEPVTLGQVNPKTRQRLDLLSSSSSNHVLLSILGSLFFVGALSNPLQSHHPLNIISKILF